MVYTKEEFKKKWESNDDCGGLTWDDVADCAKSWGVVSQPKIRPMEHVLKIVLSAADVQPIHQNIQ